MESDFNIQTFNGEAKHVPKWSGGFFHDFVIYGW